MDALYRNNLSMDATFCMSSGAILSRSKFICMNPSQNSDKDITWLGMALYGFRVEHRAGHFVDQLQHVTGSLFACRVHMIVLITQQDPRGEATRPKRRRNKLSHALSREVIHGEVSDTKKIIGLFS
jgi:hypothetical protein